MLMYCSFSSSAFCLTSDIQQTSHNFLIPWTICLFACFAFPISVSNSCLSRDIILLNAWVMPHRGCWFHYFIDIIIIIMLIQYVYNVFLYFRLQYFAEGTDDLPCSLVLLRKDDQDHTRVIGHCRLHQVLGKPQAVYLTCGEDCKLK